MPSEMAVVQEQEVQAGRCANGVVRAGEVLRITDVHGGQVADFCSFRSDDPAEFCDVIYTTLHYDRWRLGIGDALLTREMRPLWTITADTNGVHYSGGNFCSRPLRRSLGEAGDGCREGLEGELRALGLSPALLSVASCFNVFMRVDYTDGGEMLIRDPSTVPGDHVDLRAEMDALWVASVCPGEKANVRPGALRFTRLRAADDEAAGEPSGVVPESVVR